MERLDRLINLFQDEKREVKKLVVMGKIATNSFEVFENDDELANTSKDALKTEGISGRIFDRMDSTQENIDAFFPNFIATYYSFSMSFFFWSLRSDRSPSCSCSDGYIITLLCSFLFYSVSIYFLELNYLCAHPS